MNKEKNCTECDFIRMYDYGNKIYYCDHEGRTDDMGKLGVEVPTNVTPEWCPLRVKAGE